MVKIVAAGATPIVSISIINELILTLYIDFLKISTIAVNRSVDRDDWKHPPTLTVYKELSA
jgi:hypothetical protein